MVKVEKVTMKKDLKQQEAWVKRNLIVRLLVRAVFNTPQDLGRLVLEIRV